MKNLGNNAGTVMGNVAVVPFGIVKKVILDPIGAGINKISTFIAGKSENSNAASRVIINEPAREQTAGNSP